ncbi:hypothetical protein [Arthrobacter sp. IK3]|uniref:hypothetical protein n=1 Tax=Arthrobacter sp. IK3 TaxID=3448169 RepID=UPI003EDF64C9
MFETTTSAPARTIQHRAAVRQQGQSRIERTVPAGRLAALGGNYVAAFGRPGSVPAHRHALLSGAASGHGYTARFDGAEHRTPAAAVDSYTAVFGSASDAPAPAERARGSYTDANL